MNLPYKIPAGSPAAAVVAVAASTGGPAALQILLSGLPGDLEAGVIIAQHIPAGFSAPLARRLNQFSALEVREAVDGEILQVRTALVGRGGQHLVLAGNKAGFFCRLIEREAEKTFFCPSADLLFNSTARVCGPRGVAVVMTGMGKDGVEGLKVFKALGGTVLVQDEQSSVIFGMPKAVLEAGLADAVIPLSQLASRVVLEVRRISNLS